MGTRRLGGGYLQALRQDLNLIQHFREQGKLIPPEDFVDYFIASGRVVDAVVVFVPVAVEVVVFEKEMLPWQYSNIAIAETSYPKDVAGKARVKSLVYFEHNIFLATDKAPQTQDTLVFRHSEGEGILKANYEGMLT